MDEYQSIARSLGFRVTHSVKVNNEISVHGFQSEQSGLRVRYCSIPGPTVSGYFALATETTSDAGLPHTLEHLVFLGSELYPYKGVLDKLSSFCLAQGTNAWTDTDHTAYTLTTASAAGFLNLLPIYLDHILYPTLTDYGFVTEVHHINRTGENAGVVYCEMQARENTGHSRVWREMQRSMFPDEKCGYRYETGGMLEDLRSLSNEEIRSYHQQYYTDENLCIVVTGMVNVEALLSTIKTFEDKRILPKKASSKSSESVRPWLSPVLPLEGSRKSIVDIPDEEQGSDGDDSDESDEDVSDISDVSVCGSDDESSDSEVGNDEDKTGYVYIGFRLPVWADFYVREALEVLWKALIESSISPLRSRFVDGNVPSEYPEPLASHVDVTFISHRVGYYVVEFEDVTVANLDSIDAAMFDVLKRLWNAEGSIEHGLDLERIHSIIDRVERQFFASMEDSPHDTLAGFCIEDFLYGGMTYTPEEVADSKLTTSVDTELGGLCSGAAVTKRLDSLRKEPLSFWLGVLNRYVLNNPHAVVIGRPSAEFSKTLEESEKRRIADQIAEKGESELQKHGNIVDEAVKHNDADIPEHVLSSLPIPPIGRADLSLHPMCVTVSNPAVGLDGKSSEQGWTGVRTTLPGGYTLHVHELGATQFAELQIAVSTEGLSAEQRLYLELYQDVLFESPIKISGSLSAVMDSYITETQLFKEWTFDADSSTLTVSHNALVEALQEYTVSHEVSLGVPSSTSSGGSSYSTYSAFPQLFVGTVKAPEKHTEKAMMLLLLVLFNTEFTRDRVEVGLKRLLGQVSGSRRSGSYMLHACVHGTSYDRKRSNRASSIVVMQQQFLKRVQSDLAKDSEGSLSMLSSLQSALFNCPMTVPTNVRVAVDRSVSQNVTDVLCAHMKSRMDHSAGTTSTSCAASGLESLRIPTSAYVRAIRESTNGHRHIIVGIPGIESAYLEYTLPLKERLDADLKELAVTNVLIEYLTALEGPMWRRIRGCGLSYSYYMYYDFDANQLVFNLERSSDVVGAFVEAQKIVCGLDMNEMEAKAAICGRTYSVLGAVETMRSSSRYNFLHSLKHLHEGHNGDCTPNANAFGYEYIREVIKCMHEEVKLDELKAQLDNVITPWLNPKGTAPDGSSEESSPVLVVVCNPTRLERIRSEFKERAGIDLYAVQDVEEFFSLSQPQ